MTQSPVIPAALVPPTTSPAVSMRTFADATDGFSIQYPSYTQLDASKHPFSVIVGKQEDVEGPDTISVDISRDTVSCLSVPSNLDAEVKDLGTTPINGINFKTASVTGYATGQISSRTTYAAIHNNSCYTIELTTIRWDPARLGDRAAGANAVAANLDNNDRVIVQSFEFLEPNVAVASSGTAGTSAVTLDQTVATIPSNYSGPWYYPLSGQYQGGSVANLLVNVIPSSYSGDTHKSAVDAEVQKGIGTAGRGGASGGKWLAAVPFGTTPFFAFNTTVPSGQYTVYAYNGDLSADTDPSPILVAPLKVQYEVRSNTSSAPATIDQASAALQEPADNPALGGGLLFLHAFSGSISGFDSGVIVLRGGEYTGPTDYGSVTCSVPEAIQIAQCQTSFVATSPIAALPIYQSDGLWQTRLFMHSFVPGTYTVLLYGWDSSKSDEAHAQLLTQTSVNVVPLGSL